MKICSYSCEGGSLPLGMRSYLWCKHLVIRWIECNFFCRGINAEQCSFRLL